MIDAMAACARGRVWPSRSRTQAAKRACGTRAVEDEEMRSATRVIRVRGVVGSLISAAHRDDDLPARVPGFRELVGALDLAQRKHLAQLRAHVARVDELRDSR